MRELTKKRIVNFFENVISIPYCAMQYLFPDWQADYITVGVYGVNAYIFVIDRHTCIATGYHAFGNVHPSNDLRRKFDDLAKIDPKRIPELREEFVKEALRMNKG